MTYLNDIALFKLNEKVQLNEFIQIACLPPDSESKSYPGVNIPAWIVGWGSVSESGYNSDVLNNAKITVYNSSACDEVEPNSEKNWNTQICAGVLEGGIDSCYGDGGNALYVKDILNGKEKFVTAGIVSYGVTLTSF
jgi:hypothetical protein